MTRQPDDKGPQLFLGEDLEAAVVTSVAAGRTALFTTRSTDKAPGKRNEDACGLFDLGETSAVIAVADGCGGMPRGGDAADLAVRSVAMSLDKATDAERLRVPILNAFENADAAIKALGIGAATTLVVVEVQGDLIRAYHVGDSGMMLVGNRGKIRFQTIAHSPVGYAVESGFLDERGAMLHEDRNLVSNLVGFGEMRIDIGPKVRMQAMDTLVIGSDGVFDNLRQNEIVDFIRKGPLESAARGLKEACWRRMTAENGTVPSKPDDLTFALFRRHRKPAAGEAAPGPGGVTDPAP